MTINENRFQPSHADRSQRTHSLILLAPLLQQQQPQKYGPSAPPHIKYTGTVSPNLSQRARHPSEPRKHIAPTSGGDTKQKRQTKVGDKTKRERTAIGHHDPASATCCTPNSLPYPNSNSYAPYFST